MGESIIGGILKAGDAIAAGAKKQKKPIRLKPTAPAQASTPAFSVPTESTAGTIVRRSDRNPAVAQKTTAGTVVRGRDRGGISLPPPPKPIVEPASPARLETEPVFKMPEEASPAAPTATPGVQPISGQDFAQASKAAKSKLQARTGVEPTKAEAQAEAYRGVDNKQSEGMKALADQEAALGGPKTKPRDVVNPVATDVPSKSIPFRMGELVRDNKTGIGRTGKVAAILGAGFGVNELGKIIRGEPGYGYDDMKDGANKPAPFSLSDAAAQGIADIDAKTAADAASKTKAAELPDMTVTATREPDASGSSVDFSRVGKFQDQLPSGELTNLRSAQPFYLTKPTIDSSTGVMTQKGLDSGAQGINMRNAADASMRRALRNATGDRPITREELERVAASGDMDLANKNLAAARHPETREAFKIEAQQSYDDTQARVKEYARLHQERKAREAANILAKEKLAAEVAALRSGKVNKALTPDADLPPGEATKRKEIEERAKADAERTKTDRMGQEAQERIAKFVAMTGLQKEQVEALSREKAALAAYNHKQQEKLPEIIKEQGLALTKSHGPKLAAEFEKSGMFDDAMITLGADDAIIEGDKKIFVNEYMTSAARFLNWAPEIQQRAWAEINKRSGLNLPFDPNNPTAIALNIARAEHPKVK